MKEVTVEELKAMRDNNEPHQLIDVREQAEVDAAEIGGEHIPMGLVVANIDKISRDVPVIIHCRSGGRSGAIVDALERQFGFTNLYNLKGGITAWSQQIDPSVPLT
ncbi:MAG: rhodanese-like domain-containing protein [Sphingobacteriales bacterium JAD_PAG50586_3]|nr:MAG: rhodanese-like domain-containing protein [Sphingobacteriales bacterium JAD_PAG50586_3]